MITLVLAGSWSQFQYWCRESGVSPRDPKVLYLFDIKKCRALGERVQVVVYGTFWLDNPHAQELYYYAKLAEERNQHLT